MKWCAGKSVARETNRFGVVLSERLISINS